MKCTFKKDARLKGLAGVCQTRNFEVKVKRKKVGRIYSPSFRNKGCYTLGVMLEGYDTNPNCSWGWFFPDFKFKTEEEAKEFFPQWLDDLVESGKVLHFIGD